MVSLTSSFKLLVQFAVFSAVLAADVNYVFNIANGNIAPDGFTRPAVLVNGVFPGTLIEATPADTLHITVNNQLTNPLMRRSTSVHWHGLFQGRTASEDGPAMVTQCPIAPGHSYTYDIPLRGQAGTHWYHSHLSSQYVDGLRGVIVVRDPNDPHLSLYDEDNANTVITLGDWYHNPAPGIQEIYMAGNHEPIPDSGTINGRGRYIGGPTVQRTRVNVVQGKKYRLRVVNISAYSGFTFSIEGHSLTIIEVDGVSHVPKVVGGFDIYVGQRYSVIVDANQAIKNYWIRAPMELQHDSDNDNLDTDNVYAVLHYEGAPDAEPTTPAKVGASNVLEEYQLAALENPGAPGGSAPADRIIDLQFSRETSGGTKWKFNGIQYQSPSVPTLLQIISGATNPADFTTSEHTLVLNHNEIVEIHLHGSANGHVHPFHLHGHAFDVVQGNSGPINYVNPPRRDVVGIKGGTGIIRFKADNPGPWFLHCHIDWHLEAGLAVVFAEAPAEQRSGPNAQIIKQEWLDLCPIYNALPADQK
ncbi:laccase 16 [Ephemerocybe angulata]|uniref:Laccase 16 n=1 Tax=Ephemerocybe angulata TaxID=980116 RepID=A0A8H6I0G7_9AGAR|nr:laccase 16 [Tulosesus angulatus]